jgi:hypothetical protein
VGAVAVGIAPDAGDAVGRDADRRQVQPSVAPVDIAGITGTPGQ